ncbi:MAG: hypothetical protein ACOCOW_07985 [Prevotella sp.]
MINLNERVRQLTIQQRNRAVMRNRLVYGLKSFRHRPWMIALPLLLAVFTVFICCNLDNIPFPVTSEWLPLWEAIAALLTVTLATLLLWGLLVVLGTPYKARSVDNSLEHIGLVDRYEIGPALIENEKIGKSHARRYTFFSKGIDRERWEKKRGELEDILNVHLLEPIAYGKNRNYIVLVVASDVQGKEQKPLYDDEL